MSGWPSVEIRSREILQKVFGELKDRYADRPGGYTHIVRLGYRTGDAAQMALLELVDRPERSDEGKVEPAAEPKAKAVTKPKAEVKAKPEAKPKAEKSRNEPKAEAEAKKKKAGRIEK